ncbi:unnamed protein product [Didymodactylos carnosus]|uniref:Uncharacterized protein n=1 Tax=Didymodactylos carnosus TaxID=1234261 RepID=A0A814DFB9_9BILA|nr:unnamed protein product [Didymodactylos carnosus]CAF0988924.1 unnamed protein product [Didymodactylos carnosus]CAF3728824.1 unnamed protein product [Didymodactylos carnosus]CAF3759060.1 unnamed protein product [Didymodactylos carnosus]
MYLRTNSNYEPKESTFDEQERQKILRLHREMHDGKGVPAAVNGQLPRLEWLYSGDKTTSQDYLLGKKFNDKQPPPIETINPDYVSTSTIDLANKIREDPLFMIKKKEIEQRRRILENPARLKQLRDVLERTEHDEQQSHQRRKKHSHHHHSRHSRSPSPSSVHRTRERSPLTHKRRSSPPFSHKRELPPSRSSSSTKPSKSSKLSSDERDRRLQEMMSNARWRDNVRESNVKKLKEREEREEQFNENVRKRQNANSDSDDDTRAFLKPMLKQAFNEPHLHRRDIKHKKTYRN